MERDQFERICSHIYKLVDTKHFRFEDCMKVFVMYFDAYRDFTGNDGHIIPGYAQIAAIMEKMPFADVGKEIPLFPCHYEKLIPAYFLIYFPNCDRNIMHFFSGKIREYRYYEIYGGDY